MAASRSRCCHLLAHQAGRRSWRSSILALRLPPVHATPAAITIMACMHAHALHHWAASSACTMDDLDRSVHELWQIDLRRCCWHAW